MDYSHEELLLLRRVKVLECKLENLQEVVENLQLEIEELKKGKTRYDPYNRE